MERPEQDENAEQTYGEEPEEGDSIKCVGCQKPLVITIIGGYWMGNMDEFECERCFHDYL